MTTPMYQTSIHSLPLLNRGKVRDIYAVGGWNKQAPGPELPQEVAARTGEKYREAFKRLTEV